MVRNATPTDFNFIHALYMHEETNPYLLYEKMEKSDFEPIFYDLLQKRVLYIYEDEGVDTGMFKLIQYTHRTSHIAYLGGLAIHPSHIGKGQGYKMMNEIIEHGKARGLLRIELSTATINERAIRLYEKVGFQKEGVLKNYTRLEKENRFLDEVMMAYLFP